MNKIVFLLMCAVWCKVTAVMGAVGVAVANKDSAADKTSGLKVVAMNVDGKKDVNSTDVNAKNMGAGMARLHCEASPEKVTELLDAGADVSVLDDVWNATPMHFMARYGLKDCAEILLKRGALVDARDKEGQSPLCWLLTKNAYCWLDRVRSMTHWLLDHGADSDVRKQMSRSELAIFDGYGYGFNGPGFGETYDAILRERETRR